MKLDDFESVFRSAVKTRFRYEKPTLDSILLVTDMDESRTDEALEKVQRFLSHGHQGEVEWSTMAAHQFSEVANVLDRVRRNPPGMVVCYRHLLGEGAKLPYSLGSTVDTLTQATDTPVLLLPRPSDEGIELPTDTKRVMVVTDHITGDDHLVSWAVFLCADEGQLYLTHIEDKNILNKYIDVLSKIPGLETELIVEKLPKKLLSIPKDYIASTAQALEELGIHENVQSIVRIGLPMKEYQSLIKDHEIDLLVMNTKDEGQSAMDALAYALSVEIRDCPLLLL